MPFTFKKTQHFCKNPHCQRAAKNLSPGSQHHLQKFSEQRLFYFYFIFLQWLIIKKLQRLAGCLFIYILRRKHLGCDDVIEKSTSAEEEKIKLWLPRFQKTLQNFCHFFANSPKKCKKVSARLTSLASGDQLWRNTVLQCGLDAQGLIK